MFARVTHFEVDTLRTSLGEAVERFKSAVVPALHDQPGYQGVYVMCTPDGCGLLVSLWTTEDAAKAAVESGFYDEQVAKLVVLLKQPPGRDHYQVLLAEAPAADRER